MSVITMSHQMGSGGAQIARRLSDVLGYRCVGSGELAKVAERYGLLSEKVAHLGGARPTLLERLSAETRLYLVVIQAAMYGFAEQEDVILFGRGGQWLLRGVRHALRLRLVAPLEARVHRLGTSLATHSQPMGPDVVRAMIRRDDADKARRARYLYDSDLDDPMLYDMVVNTKMLEEGTVVRSIFRVIEGPDWASTPESKQIVSDRKLTAQVRAALLATEETRHYRVDVEATSGEILLTGSAGLEEGTRVASRVPGVRTVEKQLIVIPVLPPIVM